MIESRGKVVDSIETIFDVVNQNKDVKKLSTKITRSTSKKVTPKKVTESNEIN